MIAQFTTSLALALCALSIAAAEDGLGLEEKETITRTFPAAKNLDIDNFDGSIQVTGSDSPDIAVEIHKTIRARSAEKIQEAKREVRLDITPAADQDLHLYVDGPFRCKSTHGSVNYRGSRFYGYEVSFDFTVKLPRNTNLRLRTVSHGNIRVENTTGAFDVENVNGVVDLMEVAGSGHAYALNRPLHMLFSRNPTGASDFGSLNGEVDVSFRPDLSASLWMKTFNGEAYTDFDVHALPSRTESRERHDGKFVYKSNEFFGVRVGQGGPELKFDAFNGNIRIRNRGN